VDYAYSIQLPLELATETEVLSGCIGIELINRIALCGVKARHALALILFGNCRSAGLP
jgi:hypothetical protein